MPLIITENELCGCSILANRKMNAVPSFDRVSNVRALVSLEHQLFVLPVH